MKLHIEKEVFELYPDLHIAAILVNQVDNSNKNEEVLQLLSSQVTHIKENLDKESLKEHAAVQLWQAAYRKFGVKPKNYTSSIETLCRMIICGIEIGHINTLVDIYNYISLKHMIPVGGDDVDKVHGDIKLSIATGKEIFKKLKSSEVMHPKAGEVIYSDNEEVLCRRFNWRECDKTKMAAQTKNAVLLIEGLGDNAKEMVKKAANELLEMIEKYTGGNGNMQILHANNREIEI